MAPWGCSLQGSGFGGVCRTCDLPEHRGKIKHLRYLFIYCNVWTIFAGKKNRMCVMIGRRTPTGSLMVLNYYFFYSNVALSSDIKEPLSLRYILTYL